MFIYNVDTTSDVTLRLLVRRRDRETIIGDLLEEYGDVQLSSKGPLTARVWYARQMLSVVSPVVWGLTIGVAAGALQLLDTAIEPLADDSAGAMAVIVGTLMLLWVAASAAVGRSSGRFLDAVIAGFLVGAATMAVIHVSAIIRVNVFLDQLRDREDWANLLSRFHASSAQSLRAYANYEYLRQSPLLLLIGAVAGGFCGAVGGAIDRVIRTP